MFCEKCGNEIVAGGAFCVHCGAETHGSAGTKPPIQPAVQTTPKVGMLYLMLAAVRKLFGKETVWVTPEQLAQLVFEKFIYDADALFLRKVEKVIKVKGFFLWKRLFTNDGLYKLYIGPIQHQIIFGIRRRIWVYDHSAKCYHQIKDREHKKFRNFVAECINQKKKLGIEQ